MSRSDLQHCDGVDLPIEVSEKARPDCFSGQSALAAERLPWADLPISADC